MTDSRRSLRSRSLDLLRFPLAVIVAAVHVVASRVYWNGEAFIHVDTMPGAAEFFAFVDAFLRAQSVPIYFFISGYVFFLGLEFNLESYSRKLNHRVHSLLIPYISWNLLALAVTAVCFIPSITAYYPHYLQWHTDLSLPSFLETFWNSTYGLFRNPHLPPAGNAIYPQDYPLWFVRDLMIIVLCAPGIYLLLRGTKRWAVIALALAWVGLSPFELGHISQLLTGFFFFIWGAYLSYRGKDMIELMRRRFLPAVMLYPLLALGLFFGDHIMPEWIFRLLKSFCVLAGMVIAYSVAAILIERGYIRVSQFLANASFFVYVAHGIIVAHINAWLFRLIAPGNFAAVAGIYLLTLTLTISSLLGIYWILGRYAPWLQKILAGRAYRYEKKRRLVS